MGIVLGAWYLLNMLQLSLFGPRSESAHDHELRDLNTREIFALAPIAVLCVVIGVFPQAVLKPMQPDIDSIAAIYAAPGQETAVAAAAPSEARAR